MKRTTRSRKHTEQRTSRDVDAYLASLPADARTALQQLRKAISAAAPRAEEGFSYGVPGFKLEGRMFVWYGASKNHCSLYPGSAVVRTHAPDLSAYHTSKGTIRFSQERPLPSTLVRKLVKARIEELRKAKE